MDPDLLATVIQFSAALLAASIIGIIGFFVIKRDWTSKINQWFTLACWSVSAGYFSLAIGLIPYLSENGNTNSFYSSITFQIDLIGLCLALSSFIAVGLAILRGEYWLKGYYRLIWFIPAVIAIILFLIDPPFVGVGNYGDLVIRDNSFSGTVVYIMIALLLLVIIGVFYRVWIATRHRTIFYMFIGFLVAGSSVVFSLAANLLEIRSLDNLTLILITCGVSIVYIGYRKRPTENN